MLGGILGQAAGIIETPTERDLAGSLAGLALGGQGGLGAAADHGEFVNAEGIDDPFHQLTRWITAVADAISRKDCGTLTADGPLDHQDGEIITANPITPIDHQGITTPQAGDGGHQARTILEFGSTADGGVGERADHVDAGLGGVGRARCRLCGEAGSALGLIGGADSGVDDGVHGFPFVLIASYAVRHTVSTGIHSSAKKAAGLYVTVRWCTPRRPATSIPGSPPAWARHWRIIVIRYCFWPRLPACMGAT